jgi:N utilization substance protein B|tara:strand:+ start:200 stop:601 length:402 start_codon:yes stop_codon:yes gene_type:complete
MKSKKETSPVRSRDKVIQSLYEIELSGSDFKDILADLALQSRYPHFKDLLTGVINSREDIDNMLAKNMDRKLSSLDPIERSTLRLATYELLYTKTDAPIIINESIRLSKKYGAVDGHKYVNAVIDRIYKSISE